MEKYEIDYTFSARADLRNIVAYIQNVLKSPKAAESTVDTIIKSVSGLDFMPQRYAVLPEDFLEKEAFGVCKLGIALCISTLTNLISASMSLVSCTSAGSKDNN